MSLSLHLAAVAMNESKSSDVCGLVCFHVEVPEKIMGMSATQIIGRSSRLNLIEARPLNLKFLDLSSFFLSLGRKEIPSNHPAANYFASISTKIIQNHGLQTIHSPVGGGGCH